MLNGNGADVSSCLSFGNCQKKELGVIVVGLYHWLAAVGSYACEVWAPSFTNAWHVEADECALHAHQATGYKRCLRPPRGPANLLAFYVVGRHPLQVQRLFRTVRYWTKLARLAPGASLLADVFAANAAAGLDHGMAIECMSCALVAVCVPRRVLDGAHAPGQDHIDVKAVGSSERAACLLPTVACLHWCQRLCTPLVAALPGSG